MDRPNATQVAAARAVLRKFIKEGGATATDNMADIAIYSMFSCLGGPGSPAADYHGVIADATDGQVRPNSPIVQREDGSCEVVAENVYGLPVGSVFSFHPEDEEPEDELPSADELGKLNKDDLVQQINAEVGGDPAISKDDGTKDELIANLLTFRREGEWPTKASS